MSLLYRTIISKVDRYVPNKLRPLWNDERGPRTIHFWAPMMKWALVFAGMSDISRPPEKLSTKQAAALAVTGTIWSRYSLVITPPNYNFLLVNSFLAIVGSIQLSRIYLYHKSLKETAGSGEKNDCNCNSNAATAATPAIAATTATATTGKSQP